MQALNWLTLDEPIPDRVRWFKPRLADSSDEADLVDIERLEVPTETVAANVVSSLCVGGEHRPALDIDIPLVVIPSSTEGHCHLYFPTVRLSWERYVQLLDVLAACGILEEGYVAASKVRQQTLLRLPHVRKTVYDDEQFFDNQDGCPND